CGGEINVIEPGTAQRHQLNAVRGQRLQYLGVQHIVDKHADAVVPGGEVDRFVRQPRLEIAQVMMPLMVGGLEEVAVVGFGAKDSNIHAASVSVVGKHRTSIANTPAVCSTARRAMPLDFAPCWSCWCLPMFSPSASGF